MALMTDERYALCPLWQQLVRTWPHELVAVARNGPVLLKIFPELETIWLKADALGSFEQLTQHVAALSGRGSSCQLIICLEQVSLAEIDHIFAQGADEILFLAAIQVQPLILQKTLIGLQRRREQLRLAQAEVVRQHKAVQNKAEFLTWLSHEIRTPMNGVLGMTELLQEAVQNQEQLEMIDVMARSGRRVVDLVSEVLDMSRLEAGKMNLQSHEFMLRRLIEDSISLYAREANLRGLIMGDLVDSDVPDALQGDERKLSQILNNLVSNAVKYTSQGQVLIAVHVESWEGSQCRLRIDITDTGHGIAPEELTKVFAPFEQTGSAKHSRAPSSGLGLSLTKNLVELLGGHIHLVSKLGQGSTFSVSLPFQMRGEASFPMHTGLARQSAVLLSEKPERVGILREMLERSGMKVTLARPTEVLPDADWYFFGEYRDWECRPQSFWLDPRQKRVCVLRNPLVDRMQGLESSRATLPLGCEYLDLPLRQSDVYRRMTSDLIIEHSSPSLRPELSRQSMNFHGARILVVDDDVVNLKVAERQLKRLASEVTLAQSGVEALDWLDKKHFDLIFVDCQMPHMDGFELVKALRKMPQLMPGTPVIALSALSRDEDRERALNIGFTDYLAKPARMEEIQKVLGRWLPVPFHGRR